ncbi:MAG: hypothetical protein IKT39_05060 [Clostridia bacterium]|nr:hypothetical protein [Clostridia bacterium]MBR6523959.1 hypothetical protein [Clostridia bacterium]
MSIKEQIFELIKNNPGITDSELEIKLNKRHQHINNECHTLENMGKIERKFNSSKNLIGNYPVIMKKKSFNAIVYSWFKKIVTK